MGTKILLKNNRLSFPDLYEPTQFNGTGPFQYRAQLLIAANDAQRKLVDDTITAVAREKWGAKADAILKAAKAKQEICFIDGDTKAYDGYAGHWALTATRSQEKGAPLVLDTNKSPLTAKSGKPYGGCFVHTSVEFWAQDNSFGKTIRCTLLGMQFARDGDAFGAGQPPSADDFEDLGSGSTAEFDEKEESLV